ncbi:MAG TPA: alanine--glyoxylate aminotransferase family protein [Dehalococcoidia bacterium]|nr:alanine--glyoxylate aminotransferase family protein [Dehalococcoidia bacterium]
MPVNLRIPGPTPCPDDVLQAMSRQMINHRGPEFAEMIARITSGLQSLFETKNDVLTLTSAGTGAIEAAVVNTLSPGDRMLCVSIGVFGDRFADIAQTYGVSVEKLSFEQGTAADPDAVAQALKKDSGFKAVSVTHNETSTGVTNDLGAIAQAIRSVRPDILILVDAISSLGSVPLPIDAWDLDVVFTGSQKGWMVPPGMAMVSISKRGWDAVAGAKIPRYYFDFAKAKKYLETGQTPWTPAVSVYFAMDVALKKLQAEGLANIHARHARIGQLTRDGVKALGLKLLADERVASNTVTAVRVPDGVEWSALGKMMRTEYNTVLAGGQGALTGKIFRIGHLGLVSEADIQACLDALRQALPRVGFSPSGVGATAG